MPYPGSIDALILTVDPFSATTGATVVVTPPSGSPLTPTAISTDLGHTWTANPVYTVAGKWVAVWTVTGTGAGVVEEEIWVSRPATAAATVAWRPELWNVADYVPGRTLIGAVDGYGAALLTFDNTTHPAGPQVSRLITAGCAWVVMKTGPIDVSLYDAAQACAAIWTAAKIEAGWPDNRDDLSTADALYKQATDMRDDLERANEATTGVDPEDPSAHLMPVYSFPLESVQSPWGDTTFL